MDIWSTFGQEAKVKSSNDVSVFFIGAQSGGKSTLISRYVESPSDKGIKATMGLGMGIFSFRRISCLD